MKYFLINIFMYLLPNLSSLFFMEMLFEPIEIYWNNIAFSIVIWCIDNLVLVKIYQS